jgi:hypothetical protein
MTTPVFLATDETACDDDRALTAEHGRRIVRNALAIWNERCGHVGHSEMMTQANGDDLTTRAIITAGWAYVGPMHYFCPAPVGTPNASRPKPTVTLYLVGRATGSATSYVYAINENIGAPSESQMEADVAGVGDAWADITTATWTATLKVPVSAGWNRIWLAYKCGTYGEPQSLTYEFEEVDYYPYVAEMNATGRAASSHPVVFSATSASFDADCPGIALQLAASPADYAAGRFDLYTVPMVVNNATKYPGYPEDGLFYIWEPFRSTLNRIRVSTISQVPPWLNPAAITYPVTAYIIGLDVINLDTIYVDGSQEWTLEDYQHGASLRWWQLPSASAYRNAANLAEVARRAVCPMVTWFQEVSRGTTQADYPLPTVGGKPVSWVMSSTGAGTNDASLLSITDAAPFDPTPFALPTDTLVIEAKVSVAVLLVNQRREVEQARLDCTLSLFNRNSLATIATSTRQQLATVFQPGAGSLDGYSILARTVGYAEEFTYSTGRVRYGQEGLTLRADWRAWQDVTMLLEVPRATIEAQLGDPLVVRWNVAVDDPGNSADYTMARGPAGIRIKGG